MVLRITKHETFIHIMPTDNMMSKHIIVYLHSLLETEQIQTNPTAGFQPIRMLFWQS